MAASPLHRQWQRARQTDLPASCLESAHHLLQHLAWSPFGAPAATARRPWWGQAARGQGAGAATARTARTPRLSAASALSSAAGAAAACARLLCLSTSLSARAHRNAWLPAAPYPKRCWTPQQAPPAPRASAARAASRWLQWWLSSLGTRPARPAPAGARALLPSLLQQQLRAVTSRPLLQRVLGPSLWALPAATLPAAEVALC
mmetsp:Transcript_17714/g.44639  ORF Transcript_17714/g.44639 Transcript_17714/m.44639 type:complete len:204 (-) Transcript_17714:1431-2042(-)